MVFYIRSVYFYFPTGMGGKSYKRGGILMDYDEMDIMERERDFSVLVTTMGNMEGMEEDEKLLSEWNEIRLEQYYDATD